jgi:glutamine amidotransferase
MGLGWIGGTVRAFDPRRGCAFRIWAGTTSSPKGAPHPLIAAGEAYYLHSYHFADADPMSPRPAAMAAPSLPLWRATISSACQFHPEKSQAYGLATLERFLTWRP